MIVRGKQYSSRSGSAGRFRKEVKMLFDKRLEGMDKSQLVKIVVEKLRERVVGKSMRFLGDSLNWILTLGRWVY